MFGVIGTLFTSIISGGLTGIVGVAVQRFADYKNKQLDLQLSRDKMANELLLRKADAEIMQQEWSARTKVAEVEERGVEEVANAKAFEASFNEPQRYVDPTKLTSAQNWMMTGLDVVRGLVRPCLTMYLCILTTLIYFHARDILAVGQATITNEQSLELIRLIIGTVLYLTTTCVLWWFGTRNKQRAPDVN